MPLYEYQCDRCGRFEVIRKFSDPALTECPTCGQEIQKLLSAPAIQFKGTGWYITDYARKSGGESGKDGAGKSSSSKDDGGAKDSGSSKESGGAKDGAGKAGDGASSTPAPAPSTPSGTGTAKGGAGSSSS